MQVSIIVPVFNEATLICPFLEHLRERAPGAEVIVADGGSSDGTAELAAGLSHRVVHGEPGRAAQMNAGALVARGEVLWFLHADVNVPLQCRNEIGSWDLLSANCICWCWRISGGAIDGRCGIFSAAPSLRSRGVQREANCGKPSQI